MFATSIYAPFSKRPPMQDAKEGAFTIATVLTYNFSTITWLLVGASSQALAVYLFSGGHYVLLISTVLLIAKLIRTFLQTYNVTSNPYLQDVIAGRTTAQMPNAETGEIESASARKIAVLHLGAKSNHPLGMLAPQFREVGAYVSKMSKELNLGMHNGFLGQTTFYRNDERGAPETTLISYWESIEDIHAFAHDARSHRDAWQWWERTIKDNGYVGINHEIFEADAKHWETVYVNFRPTMMGATTFIKRGGKTLEGGVVADEWVSPLVDAKRGKLSKSSARLGRQLTSHDQSRVAKDVYE